MRRAWLIPALLALGLSSSGCRLDDSGTAVELTVRVQSQGDVGDLSFRLWTVDGTAPRMIGNRTVDRTVAELAADPVELRFSPLSRTSYVLHLAGTSPGGDVFVATRCYVLDDSMTDTVLLAGPLGPLDGDGDSFVGDPAAFCFEPGPRACGPEDHRCDTAVADCDDTDASIYPGAPFLCQNGIDEDCDGRDEACGDNDGDGVNACATTAMTGCDCNDDDATISPRAEDICLDGIDQDCDGIDACCDADGDGFPQCRADGEPTGDCVDVPADCVGGGGCVPASINPGMPELCDGIDNNCNGTIDEVDDCRGPDLDGDGVLACGRAPEGQPCEDPIYDCDPGIHPGANERCGNGIDDDLDGMIDEVAACPAGDADNDGEVAPRDCDDTDPLAYTHAPGEDVIDRCGDGVAQSCVPGEDRSCSDDLDGDGFVEPLRCEGNAMINPDRPEICNGIDDDCDGTTDEVLDRTGSVGCVGGMSVLFASDFGHCGACRNLCNPVTADQCRSGVCDCSGQDTPGGTPAACTGTDVCCGGSGCRNIDSDPSNCGGCGIACGQGETCAGGTCRCGGIAGAGMGVQACPEPGGVGGVEVSVCCGGGCVDVRADTTNCGGCGVVCGTTAAVCDDRICRCDPAAPTMADCDGDLGRNGNGCETPTDRTLAHCGGCGRNCSPANATPACSGSVCSFLRCNVGWDDCDRLASDGCETDLRTVTNCGSCGTPCSLPNAMGSCASGSCRVGTCNAGWGDCNSDGTSCETRLNTLADCGLCRTPCSIPNASATCTSSMCRISTCNMGWADCNGDGTSCESPLNTLTNCGTCGVTCEIPNASESCATRSCRVTVCDPGWADCDMNGTSCETSLATESDCGACGVSCAMGAFCTGGVCRCAGSSECTALQGDGCQGPTCRCNSGPFCLAPTICMAGGCF